MVQADQSTADQASTSPFDVMADPRLLKDIDPSHRQILRGLSVGHQLFAARALDISLVRPSSMEWNIFMQILQAEGLEVGMRKMGGEDIFQFKFPVKNQDGNPDGFYSITLKGYDPQKPDWVDFQHVPANSQVPVQGKTPDFDGQYSLCLFQTANSLGHIVPALGIRVLESKGVPQGTVYGFDIQGRVRREQITIPPRL